MQKGNLKVTQPQVRDAPTARKLLSIRKSETNRRKKEGTGAERELQKPRAGKIKTNEEARENGLKHRTILGRQMSEVP